MGNAGVGVVKMEVEVGLELDPSSWAGEDVTPSVALTLSLLCVGFSVAVNEISGLFDTDVDGDDDGPSGGVVVQVPELPCLEGLERPISWRT